MGIGACRRARSSARQENFVGIAFRDRWKHHERFRLGARAGLDAFSGIITNVSGFASASGGFANTRAQGVGIFAGAITAAAFLVDFVVIAFRERWEHHERFRLNLSRAFAGFDTFSGLITEMTFFASAAGDANTGADRIGVLAGAVASFALTKFFVITAHLRRDGDHLGSWYAASFRMNAYALFVFQESRFAEATDDAIASADRARVRVGARGRASGSATFENFVFFALGNFRGISEELHGFVGIALASWHANAASVSQMSFFAEASDDAVLGANRAWIGIGAGGSASRAAWIEKFVVRAFWFGLRELHGDIVVRGLAILRAYTFTLSVFQVSLITETTDHALEGTHQRWLRVSTILYASGSTCRINGIGTAFFIDGKSRSGDSEPEGTNGQKQHGS